MNPATDAALVLWNVDVIDLVTFVLDEKQIRSAGLQPSAEPEAIQKFITKYDPHVVVFDLAPPYQFSAKIAAELVSRNLEREFIFGCADSRAALQTASWLDAFPVFQKPFNLQALTEVILSLSWRGSVFSRNLRHFSHT